jgi:uncharacterized protein YlxW (UPF0749 family)
VKIGRNIAITFVCIILGIMVAWQYKSINYNQTMAITQNRRVEELKDDIIRLQNTNSELRTRLEELKKENLAFEKGRIDSNETTIWLQEELKRARIFGGFLDVMGKGVIVTIDNNEFAKVSESDIFDVINELRAAGAQAISVNEERIVAMSEIRETGRYILINGVQMEAPFVIKAISDPGNLERSLNMIDGVIDRLKEWQLKATVKKMDEIIIPKAPILLGLYFGWFALQ